MEADGCLNHRRSVKVKVGRRLSVGEDSSLSTRLSVAVRTVHERFPFYAAELAS